MGLKLWQIDDTIYTKKLSVGTFHRTNLGEEQAVADDEQRPYHGFLRLDKLPQRRYLRKEPKL
jgi:hypothetical protein